MKRGIKLVHGVGDNDADYNVFKHVLVDGKWKKTWRCPFYSTWVHMLERCYSSKYQDRQPTYIGCTVCDEWLTFSNFKSWMEQQDWQGNALDKDLLKVENKIYCPECCIFIDSKINNFVIDHGNARGEYMLGVSWFKRDSKFTSRCRNPFTGKLEHLGYFTNELEAYLTWKRKKHEHACQLADSEYCNDPRLAEALRTRYL